jgi:hypothetical protein
MGSDSDREYVTGSGRKNTGGLFSLSIRSLPEWPAQKLPLKVRLLTFLV